ncbi:MAG: hypothetical protein A3B66_07555 [Alphaproteobacteria bacterium RIFCSPHIGHO2_02_FULL_46_13]|nr:MAG: hypothetical protein A3B66_07555 [Alphaproteobacteria bacterium RIFCSPHIGHO2_02_FULL_46_13]
MFFMLSKLFWVLFAPMTFISFLIAGGFLARRYKVGRIAMGMGISLLLLCGFFPIGNNLLVYQENQFPLLKNLPPKVDGIIVLGGSIELERSVARGQVQMNEHAPRVTEMMALAKLYPKAKIVFSGGNGRFKETSSSEAKETDKILKSVGFDTSRMVYEGESRNTYENFMFSKKLVDPKPNEIWLLDTSAFHMKRAVGIFRSNGWDVIPYPAGYLTDGNYEFVPNFDVLGNMYKLQIAVKEMIGMMAYTLTGKIKLNEVTDPLPVSSGPAGH